MKSQLNLKKAIITALFVIIGTAVFAQTGKISGKVSDKKTGETLIGVTVKIAGTTKGAATDVEGRYLIGGVAPGKYTIEASYVGYTSKNISDVEVKANSSTVVDLIMDDSNDQKLNEVVITANVSKESINTLYANQKSSISISSGISAELIKKSPDKNTSEVLKRVSGASIQDNKYIIVRGLSDRYNSAMLNNSILPNTEVDKKAFSFDIIPSNLIDAIVINKTASADMPADFSGGVVQITTKDFPDSRFLNLSLGTSYNTQSAFKDFLAPQKSGNEIFGFYDKRRDIPAAFPSRTDYIVKPEAERFALSRQFSNNWGYDKITSTLGPNFQVNYGTSKVFKNDSKFGTILSLTYRYDERLKESDQIAYTGQNVGDKYHDNAYNYNTNIGGLANFAYSWGTNKIALKNLYNRVLESQFILREGIDESGSGFTRTGDYLLQRSLLSSQLTGNHLLSSVSKIKLDWGLNFSNIDRKEPGYKRMEYTDSGDGILIASIPSSGSASGGFGGNFSSLLNENSYGGSADLTIPVKWFRDNNKIKLGYFGQYRKRDFSARNIGFIQSATGFNNDLLKLPQDQIFDSKNIRPGGFIIDEGTNGSDKYDANSLLNAGYVMFDGYLTEKLRLGIGARIESFSQKLNSTDNSSRALKVDTTYLNVLPSANLIYNLTEKASVRLSASQTVGRAEFREIAPFSFYDFNRNVNVFGEPKLRQSKTTNVDLGYALYPASGEAFTASAFFKHFDSPIEQQLDPAASGRSFGYFNAKSATLYGIEAELRKTLGFLGDQFSNFTFNANASYIKSEVKVPTTVNTTGKRPMQGQSPYLINAGLQYTSKTENPSSVTLLFNRIGKRIWVVGNVRDPDIYENPRNILDLQLSQKFAKSRAEVKLNYSDILNNKAIYYQKPKGAEPNAAFDKNTDHVNIADRFGSTVSLSLSYTIK